MARRSKRETKPNEAILITSVPSIIYLTKFSGFSGKEREAFLFIANTKKYILTDGRYTTAVKTLISDFELIEISAKNSFKEILKQLINKHKIKRLGFEGNNLTFLEHQAIKKYFNNIYHLSISDFRSIKTAEEILAIEKACRLGDRTFDYILKKIKLGVSEKEIAFELEFFIKKNGGELSFPSIVAFGKNSAFPHHQTSNQRLASSGQFVLLDFGVKLNNYCSDMTRTVIFGSENEEFKKMYQTVLDAQNKAINYLQQCHSELVSESQVKTISRNKFGMTGKDVDKIARDFIISKGYPTIPHSLGHGIGIEVHEKPTLSPKSKDILKKGMVFTIEPGIYIPEFGGVRIEDVIVIEKQGIRLLTQSPKNLIQL